MSNKKTNFRIIDSHIHIFPEKQAKVVYEWVKRLGFELQEMYDPDKIAEYLNKSGVGKAFVLNFAHKPGTAKSINDWTLSICEKNEKLIPFGTVHAKGPKVREEAERALDGGCKGLKLHPPAQRFHPLAEVMESTYELMSDMGKPVFFHCGFFEDEDFHKYSRPEYFEKIAEKFPELKICLAHVCHFFTEKTAVGNFPILDKYENVFFDTAHWFSDAFQSNYNPPLNFEDLKPAFEKYPDRFLFGSDFPTTGIEIEEQVNNLLGLNIDEKILKKLGKENAEKLIDDI